MAFGLAWFVLWLYGWEEEDNRIGSGHDTCRTDRCVERNAVKETLRIEETSKHFLKLIIGGIGGNIYFVGGQIGPNKVVVFSFLSSP
jgi:hypothetical protein